MIPCESRNRGVSDQLTSLEQARRIAHLAQEKLARDVVILDMRPVCSYTDYFVLATGGNSRQAKAIYDEVHERLKKEAKLAPRNVHGSGEATCEGRASSRHGRRVLLVLRSRLPS